MISIEWPMRREKVEINFLDGEHSRPRAGYIVLYNAAELPTLVQSIYELIGVELPLNELRCIEAHERDALLDQLQTAAECSLLDHLEELIDLPSLPLTLLQTFRVELVERWLTQAKEQAAALIDRLDTLIAEAEFREAALLEEEAERQAILKFMASGRKPGFIYLLRAQTGEWKIGHTNNPYNRIKTFNVKLPFGVEYEHLIPTNEMTKAEAMLHKMFADKRIDGEWFALTTDNVAYIKALKRLDM